MEAFRGLVRRFRVCCFSYENSFIVVMLIVGMSCDVALALYCYRSSGLW